MASDGAKRAAKEGQRRQSKKAAPAVEPEPQAPVEAAPDNVEQVAAEILNTSRCYGKLYEAGNIDCDVNCGWTLDCKLLMKKNAEAYDGVQAMVEAPVAEAAV